MAHLTVAIDASSAVTGGGITYLERLLPALKATEDIQIGPILVRSDVAGLREALMSFGQVVMGRGRAAALSPRWRSAIARSSVDVVYSPTEISFAAYTQPLLLALRNPCMDPKNVRYYTGIRRAKWSVQRRLARASVRHATAYIAVSQYARDVGVRCLGVDSSKVTVVYHGAEDSSSVRPQRPCKRFLFVSNLYRYKNLDVALEALAGVERSWTLDVVGAFIEPDYERRIRKLISARRLGENVRLLGHRSSRALAALYRRSDCLLWPSYAETFGHPLLEARSHGLPIIAAEAASNREIVGEAALYFAPKDRAGLQTLLNEAIDKGIGPGPLPRRYSWDKCGNDTVAALRRAYEGW